MVSNILYTKKSYLNFGLTLYSQPFPFLKSYFLDFLCLKSYGFVTEPINVLAYAFVNLLIFIDNIVRPFFLFFVSKITTFFVCIIANLLLRDLLILRFYNVVIARAMKKYRRCY